MSNARSKEGETIALIDAATTILRHAAKHLHAAPGIKDALMDFYMDPDVWKVISAAQSRCVRRYNQLRRQDEDSGTNLTAAERREINALASIMCRGGEHDPWTENALDLIEHAAPLVAPPAVSTAH